LSFLYFSFVAKLKFQKGSVFMRKFLSVLLAISLTVCFASAVLAISSTPVPENGDDTKVLLNGQEVDPGALTIEELKDIYGYKSLQEGRAAKQAYDSEAYALAIPNIETLYGDALDRVIKKDRNDFLGDLAVALMEQGTGGGAYQDPGQYSPYEGSVELIEYLIGRAQEMGFELNGTTSRIVRVMAPNYTVPPHKRSLRVAGQTDLQYWDGPSLYPLYMYVELGHKNLPETSLTVQHTDPWEDTGGIRGDRGGWTNDPIGQVYVTPIHLTMPNRFWTLGGSHQANVIRDPVSMRWVMLGRGGDDDRGPGVGMLYALKAVKDSNVPLRRRIRVIFGTTEDSTTMFRHPGSTASTHGRPYFGTTGSFGDMSYYLHQDETPIMGTTADAGVTAIMYGQSSSAASISSIVLNWTNTANSIGLRFPNALTYTSESYGGSSISAPNQWGSGSGTSPANFTDGAPTAIPALLYNQGRDAFQHKAYFVGTASGTGNGQSLQLVTWLVPPAATAAQVTSLLDAANTLKNSYRISWGGWEYPDEKLSRPALQKVPLAGRWDAGIDVIRVDTRTGMTYSTANANANAVQVVATGHVTRFWEKEYFSPRHIMADFLSKLTIPSGFTAPWQNEFRKLIAFYPFDNFRERKVWNGNTMVGNNLGKIIYAGTLSNFASLAPTFNSLISEDSSYVRAGPNHVAEAWTNKYTNASVAYANRGRNDENVTRVTASINFTFTSTVTPDDNVYFNGLVHGTLLAPAVRLRLTELGLSGTVGTSANVTGTMYVRADHDALHKSMKAHNNYYKKFGVLDPGYTGEIKEDRPDFINGGTYANSFRYTGALQEGRLIATGGWGGRGTLHGWNERVELDGMVDFVKRSARMLAEYSAGVPHTWTVTGANMQPASQAPYKGFAEKNKLNYAISNDVVSDIYIQEEVTATPIVAKLYAEGKIDRSETTEILFARKFWQNGNIALTTTLINPNGTNKGSGKVLLFAKVGTSADVTANWNLVATGTAGSANFTFTDGSVYDQRTAANNVEVSVLALAVTNGSSVPLDISGEGLEADETLRQHVKDTAEKNGCNAGFAILALAVLPFIRRRK
jgi:hypothetical protein